MSDSSFDTTPCNAKGCDPGKQIQLWLHKPSALVELVIFPQTEKLNVPIVILKLLNATPRVVAEVNRFN